MWTVTSWVGNRNVGFRVPVDTPSLRHTVTVGWPDLLRGLLRGHLLVWIVVAGPGDEAPVKNGGGSRGPILR